MDRWDVAHVVRTANSGQSTSGAELKPPPGPVDRPPPGPVERAPLGPVDSPPPGPVESPPPGPVDIPPPGPVDIPPPGPVDIPPRGPVDRPPPGPVDKPPPGPVERSRGQPLSVMTTILAPTPPTSCDQYGRRRLYQLHLTRGRALTRSALPITPDSASRHPLRTAGSLRLSHGRSRICRRSLKFIPESKMSEVSPR
jgi:hypothetical protein